MADWYLGSVSHTAVPQFAISHAYSIGDFVRALAAPSASNEHVFRCTTAGTSAGSEAAWNMNNNATTAQGTAVFTCVSGQSTYAWSAPFGSFGALSGQGTGTSRLTASGGDRIFTASDHAETKAANLVLTGPTSGATLVISVNKAGATPPGAADYLAGASFINTGATTYTIDGAIKWEGITFNCGGTVNGIRICNNSQRTPWFKDCLLWLNMATNGATIQSNTEPGKWVWENTRLQVGHISQTINLGIGNNALDWFNTPNAIAGAVIPTNLFTVNASADNSHSTIRSVDLSALNTTLVTTTAGATAPGKRMTFQNCKLNASVTAFVNASTLNSEGAQVELLNCDSGNSNYRNERHCAPQGDVTTETTITLSGGATDGTTNFSRKMVSSSAVNQYLLALEGFPMDVWSASTAGAKTATAEIISSGTLTNADISLQVEYLGDAASCQGSTVDSYLGGSNDLATAANVTASSAVWNASPATPVTQKLQVTFTQLKAGTVRGIVSLRKASATIYVNPQMTIA